KTRVHFELFYGHNRADREGECKLLHYAVIGFAHDMGFPKVTASGFHFANGVQRTWEEHSAPLVRKDAASPDDDENPKGNADVKAYPVRTPLSRYLTWDVDCLIIIVPALDTDQGRIPEKIRAATIKAVAEMKLP